MMATFGHHSFTAYSRLNVNLKAMGGDEALGDNTSCRGHVMKKVVTALVAAATIAVAAVATSGAADARPWGWHGGWGWRGGWGPGPFVGGLVAGAVVGSALAAPYYYPYGYGPYPYGPCAWRTVWNGYRWVRACY
jgi:hypothetical protein